MTEREKLEIVGRKRDRFADIALGLIAGVGLATLFAVWAVPGFLDPADTQARQPSAAIVSVSNKDRDLSDGDWRPKFTPSDTYAQWIAAIVAIASTGVSIWAVKLVRDTLEETRRTATAAEEQINVARSIGQAQARAYVVLGKVDVKSVIERIVIKVRFANIGQTPVRNACLQFQVTEVEPTTPKFDPAVPNETLQFNIGSDTERLISLFPEDPQLCLAVTFGEATAWVHGIIEYKDVFGDTHHTWFRIEVNGSAKRDMSARITHEGNNTT